MMAGRAVARRLAGRLRLGPACTLSTEASWPREPCSASVARAPIFVKPVPSLATETFSWEDPLQLADQLTEEERGMYETARGFAEKELRPNVVQYARDAYFDPGIMRALGSVGLLGVTAPPEHGGGGAGYVAYGLCARAVEAVDSSYRSAMSVQSSLVMHPIAIFGSEDQKRQWLPRLAAGAAIGCFGLTEPGHGSDPAGMDTRAKWDPVSREWVLTGAKTWITNAPIADLLLVWARADADAGAVRGFLVDRSAVDRLQPGALATPPIQNKLSLRGSMTGSILLDAVRVPEQAMLPTARGLAGPFACLTSARYGIAWGALGAAEDCVAIGRSYALGRKQFGAPLAAQQLVQKKLADAVSEIGIGMQAALAVGRAKERGRFSVEMVSVIKRNSVGKALAIARDCRDILGANGVADEYHVMRHMMNLEAVNTYEGTHDMHALILGRAITGIPAFVSGEARR